MSTEIVILASGNSTRMQSSKTKLLHEIGCKSIIEHVLDKCVSIANNTCHVNVVVGNNVDLINQIKFKYVDRVDIICEYEPNGTGLSVAYALQNIHRKYDDVVVLYGDVPFVPADIIRRLVHSDKNCFVVCEINASMIDMPYGRVVQRDGKNIVIEYSDASDIERSSKFINAGAYRFDAQIIQAALSNITNDNAQQEYYLTDALKYCDADLIIHQNCDDFIGINTPADIAAAEQYFQKKKRQQLIDYGVLMQLPEHTYFAHDTSISVSHNGFVDILVEPFCYFGPRVILEHGCTIKANCYLENCVVRSGAIVGPFARIRGGCDIGCKAQVGNFVEIKSSDIGDRSKVKHLSYLGDCNIGSMSNVGAGAITCNYNGFNKAKTIIGDNAFIGSNVSIIAPARVGDNTIVAAGTVLTEDVVDDALAISRPTLNIKEGYYNKHKKKHCVSNNR